MIRRRAAVAIWLVLLLAAALFASQLRISTDMAEFLPASSTPAQRVLVDQLRDGVVSHLVLVAITGVPVAQSAGISRDMAARLRDDAEFTEVENGEASGFARDRDFLWANRYVLSDQVDAAQFSHAGLRGALEQDLAELGTMSGFLLQPTLAADPTGELRHILVQLVGNSSGPARRNGVWVSADGSRALLLLRLRAAGSDIDGAQQALAAVRRAFAAATPMADRAARLEMSGPPVFAVAARARIKSDATRLSVLASLLVAATLLAAYRSPRILLLAFVPVASGALSGIVAVGLVYRNVHGITLGFGATLIGEAVDYAIYLLSQTTPESPVARTLARIWPTLVLGVLTSICGFSAMLLSGFQGFAQLGLFTIAGLVVAVCVTRFVLPALLPAGFAGVRQSRLMVRVAGLALRLRPLRGGVGILAVVAAASLAMGQGPFWASDLASLSPVPAADQRLDQELRHDMRAPDAAYLVVIRRPDQQAALVAAERLDAALRPLVGQGALAGLDAPSRYLPSLAMQQARQAALPGPQILAATLQAALDGLPFQPGYFAPFLRDVAIAREQAPISRASLDGTSLAVRLDTLLVHQPGGWVATLPLRGVAAPAIIARAISGQPDATLVGLRAESDRLLRTYLHQGATLAGLGAVAIALLLLVSLRSLRRFARVAAPLVAAVLVTLAVLRLGGHALSIFNLFGVLLVVAIGSNYCLFFDRHRADPAGMPRVMLSLLLANGCTVMGFGVLALSRTPVLHDLGLPVAIGTLLSLVFAAILMSPPAPR